MSLSVHSPTAIFNLIATVRNEQVLWNPKHEQHSSKVHTDNAWKVVSDATGLNPVDVRQTWKTLRSQYRKLYRQAELDATKLIVWRYYEALSFLSCIYEDRYPVQKTTPKQYKRDYSDANPIQSTPMESMSNPAMYAQSHGQSSVPMLSIQPTLNELVENHFRMSFQRADMNSDLHSNSQRFHIQPYRNAARSEYHIPTHSTTSTTTDCNMNSNLFTTHSNPTNKQVNTNLMNSNIYFSSNKSPMEPPKKKLSKVNNINSHFSIIPPQPISTNRIMDTSTDTFSDNSNSCLFGGSPEFFSKAPSNTTSLPITAMSIAKPLSKPASGRTPEPPFGSLISNHSNTTFRPTTTKSILKPLLKTPSGKTIGPPTSILNHSNTISHPITSRSIPKPLLKPPYVRTTGPPTGNPILNHCNTTSHPTISKSIPKPLSNPPSGRTTEPSNSFKPIHSLTSHPNFSTHTTSVPIPLPTASTPQPVPVPTPSRTITYPKTHACSVTLVKLPLAEEDFDKTFIVRSSSAAQVIPSHLMSPPTTPPPRLSPCPEIRSTSMQIDDIKYEAEDMLFFQSLMPYMEALTLVQKLRVRRQFTTILIKEMEDNL